ncbi:MAG: glyoxylate/hydroxypyruvate reductase A, partial [Pseudomonadota bacterium]
MTLTVLFGGKPAERESWGEALQRELADRDDVEVILDPAQAEAQAVDAVVYNPEGPVTDFTPYPRLRAVLSMWAGVETIVDDPAIQAPLTRMVEPGLTEGMTDWVVAHVMRLHCGIDRHIHAGPTDWDAWHPPLSRFRKVGVLGLGELGADAARMLGRLRFDVAGWSRTPKTIEGVDCRHADEGLEAVLRRSEILVLLLPLTPATENLMNAERLAMLPRGAFLLNPGRGPLIDDAALLAALESGGVAHAVLDVFREEPLPADHPYRAHPSVTVTPHIASVTRSETAAAALAAQIRRLADGE